MGDAAYGDVAPARPSPTRNAAWWPKCRAGPTGQKCSPDLAAGSCAGYPHHRPAGNRTDGAGPIDCAFDGAVCGVCPLPRIAAQGRQGRRVLIHPQELLPGPGLGKAPTPGGSGAQIGPLGIRQSRYFRVKSCTWRPRHWPISLLSVGRNRAVGQYRWRRSRPPAVVAKRRPISRRPARTTMVPFGSLGFTAATTLLRPGF